MKSRIAIYLTVACLIFSVVGLLELIEDNQRLREDLEYPAVGIKLVFNDEVYAESGPNSGWGSVCALGANKWGLTSG